MKFLMCVNLMTHAVPHNIPSLCRPIIDTGRSRRPCRLSVRLRALDCWDRGFEYRGGHGRSSLAFVVCCVGSSLCDKLITGSQDSYGVCMCKNVCDVLASIMRRPRPGTGL
jgi:hypothetical protein